MTKDDSEFLIIPELRDNSQNSSQERCDVPCGRRNSNAIDRIFWEPVEKHC